MSCHPFEPSAEMLGVGRRSQAPALPCWSVFSAVWCTRRKRTRQPPADPLGWSSAPTTHACQIASPGGNRRRPTRRHEPTEVESRTTAAAAPAAGRAPCQARRTLLSHVCNGTHRDTRRSTWSSRDPSPAASTAGHSEGHCSTSQRSGTSEEYFLDGTTASRYVPKEGTELDREGKRGNVEPASCAPFNTDSSSTGRLTGRSTVIVVGTSAWATTCSAATAVSSC